MHLREGAAVRELRVGHGLAHGAVGGRRHGVAIEHGLALDAGKLPRPGLELVHEHAPVGAAIEIDGKAGVRDPIGPAGGRRHALEGALADYG